ncbi:hypothetical protein [uncultured Tenacibaculum sp.]|uniref:hypothetical protein n=1 Tax=uncultured Tenacibaculum sp. TaxID=174713 RepID=UPI002628D2B6|nr:hypothetical protein [uncultured Tenacibaculum sp.]
MKFKKVFNLIILLVLICSCSNLQKEKKFILKNNIVFLKTELNSDSKIGMYDFFKNVTSLSENEKIELIEELLKYKGNNRVSKPFILCYNKNLSQMYLGNIKNTTVEIEALLFINQLYFDNPFYYSPYPIIIDSNQKAINNNQKAMDSVYNSYIKWFEIIKKKGINKAKRENILPLLNTDYKWIYGIDVSPISKLQFKI